MKLKKTIKYISIATMLITLGYFTMMFFSLRADQNEKKETVANISNENTPGKVLGEEGSVSAADAAGMYASQNFRAPQISFGGDAITLPSGEQSLTPEILDMRSEVLATKTDQKAKFILAWKTNKLCRSSIEYMKEGQAEGEKISEDGYGFTHNVEIAPLDYSTSYSYVVTARDKWGNETKSDKLVFYTGMQNISIIDLLAGAFRDMFGWATNNVK